MVKKKNKKKIQTKKAKRKNKEKSKKKVTKIKELKSNIKEIKKKPDEQENQKDEESSLEETIDENENQIRNIGFQKFIQTGSSISSPVLGEVSSPQIQQTSHLESEPLEMDLESENESSRRDKDEVASETSIEQYAVPEPSMEQYREIVREQARMSSEVSPIQANERPDFETIGRQQERIGTEAGMINSEELMGMQGSGGSGSRAMSEEYDIVNPEQVGFERTKDTRPFQNDSLKKSYDERI